MLTWIVTRKSLKAGYLCRQVEEGLPAGFDGARFPRVAESLTHGPEGRSPCGK